MSEWFHRARLGDLGAWSAFKSILYLDYWHQNVLCKVFSPSLPQSFREESWFILLCLYHKIVPADYHCGITVTATTDLHISSGDSNRPPLTFFTFWKILLTFFKPWLLLEFGHCEHVSAIIAPPILHKLLRTIWGPLIFDTPLVFNGLRCGMPFVCTWELSQVCWSKP